MATPRPIRFAVPRDPDDIPAICRLLNLAFTSPLDQIEQTYLRVLGIDQLRVARPADTPDHQPPGACLARLPMGQYFGGRCVPMVGIAAVAVAPEARGRGLALGLMQEAVREMHRDNVPLSCLYPSTQALYRQVGYEQAGHRFRFELDLARIGVTDRAMHLRPVTDDDEPMIRACQRRFAAASDGMLERCELLWKRTRAWRGNAYSGFAVAESESAEIEGYLFLRQTLDPAIFRTDMSLSDLAFTTARAGRRLLGFLADFGSMVRTVDFHSGPVHPLISLMPQQVYKSEFRFHWMLRVIDAPAAIAARGWPAGLQTALTLRLHDDLIPENRGDWRLTIERGRASLERIATPDSAAPHAAPPDAELDIRALACLYAGFLSVPQAQITGMVRATPDGLPKLASAFPPGCAGMVDMF